MSIKPHALLELLGSDWANEIPGVDDLRRYTERVGPNVAPLCDLIDDPDDLIEFAAAANLIWYLNSGGRRNYVFASRPDREVRTHPMPDFLLFESVTRGHLALEVTNVFRSRDVTGSIPLRRWVADVLGNMLNDHVENLPCTGSFVVVVRQGSMRGLDHVHALVQMATAIHRGAGYISRDDEIRVIDEAFQIHIIRKGAAEHATFDVIIEEDYIIRERAMEKMREIATSFWNGESRDPVRSYDEWFNNWAIPDELSTTFRRVLMESDRKFQSMPDMEGVLLITVNFPLFLDEARLYVHRLQDLYGEASLVDRFYLRYEDDRSMQWRIRRVW